MSGGGGGGGSGGGGSGGGGGGGSGGGSGGKDGRSRHPSAAMAAHGRALVRPRLRPFPSVGPALPRSQRALAVPQVSIAEVNNGRPEDVMLQGFHVTSCQSRNPSWYQILAQNAGRVRNAGITLVWLPPPSESASDNGYLPTRWQVLDGAYGSGQELAAAITALDPALAIADVVVNHRCGVATAGADFDSPPFPDQLAAICSDDESHIGTGAPDTGENQKAARDLDHTNPEVQAAIAGYLSELKAAGFQGWRYDEAKGYAGRFLEIYNGASTPYFSVGEYWDSDRQAVMNWIDATGGRSMAFDFPTRTLLKSAIGDRQFSLLKTIDGKPTGAIGWWPAMSVTFLENHDTEQDSFSPDPFGNGDQVLQGYAYLLTHPGIPCVFWTHLFDYGADVQAKLEALIGVRKGQGLNRGSVVNIAAADDGGRYAAIIDDKVAVKLGPAPWDPGSGWTVATDGNDYAVWIRGS